MSARALLVWVVVGLAAVLAGCGGGASTTAATAAGGASTGSATGVTSASIAAPAGFTTYRGRGYELSVPSWKPFVTQSADGRISTGWSTPGTGNFTILVIDDPHPGVSLATAVKTSAQASRTSYHVTTQTVASARVAGASAAKLITDYGPHGVGPYHAVAQHDANLILTTPGGAMINVLVVSHGAGNPDPTSVIDSFRLSG